MLSIFIGGGTPSLFSPKSIEALILAIQERLSLSADAEITLEANPGSSEMDKFRGYRAAGVNRLSIGIQSFDNRMLKQLGRVHGRDEALRAADAASAAGFDNINLDLMYGLPGQSADQALADVNTAIKMNSAHLSAYQLTIEPNTYFHSHPPTLPDDDVSWDIQMLVAAALREAGYLQYEVSAYARPENECRHNVNYWRYGDYLGIGAGAHGKISTANSISRSWKVKNPKEYLKRAATREFTGSKTLISDRDAVFEFMLNALRLTGGFKVHLFQERTGLPLDAIETSLQLAQAKGLIARDIRQIEPTERGRRFLNNLQELFL